MEYGFVYIWYDRKRKMYYIGSHWGTEDDGYICSSNRMRNVYRRRPKDFKRRILERVKIDRKSLLETEEKWLQMVKNKQRYYNLRFSVSRPPINPIKHWSFDPNKRKETTEKISAALSGRKLSKQHLEKNRARRPTDETRQKMSIAHTGMKHSIKTRQKMSTTRMGNQYGVGAIRSNEFKAHVSKVHTGKVNSEETRLKMSAAKKLWWKNKRAQQL